MKREEKKRRVKTFFAGFKDFVSRGNVIDLAVAVIIGAAFGKITTSLVNDIIMPPIGLLINGVDFKDLVWVIKAAEIDAITNEVIKAAIQIRYGVFLMTIIEFLIIAFSIYASLNLVIRRREFVEKVKAEMEAENEAKLAEEEQEDKPEEEPVEEVIPEDILLLREIRDSLKEKN